MDEPLRGGGGGVRILRQGGVAGGQQRGAASQDAAREDRRTPPSTKTRMVPSGGATPPRESESLPGGVRPLLLPVREATLGSPKRCAEGGLQRGDGSHDTALEDNARTPPSTKTRMVLSGGGGSGRPPRGSLPRGEGVTHLLLPAREPKLGSLPGGVMPLLLPAREPKLGSRAWPPLLRPLRLLHCSTPSNIAGVSSFCKITFAPNSLRWPLHSSSMLGGIPCCKPTVADTYLRASRLWSTAALTTSLSERKPCGTCSKERQFWRTAARTISRSARIAAGRYLKALPDVSACKAASRNSRSFCRASATRSNAEGVRETASRAMSQSARISAAAY